jgi:phosphate starvation-inducible PhoH-like protein
MYEFINFAVGKTFDDSLRLVNECEQYTKDNLRLILTRLGENSKMILTGDSLQTNRRDIVTKKSESGLLYAIDHIGKLDEVGITEFGREDIVRNPLITKILDNWD